jgi:hypothetical protein
MKIFLVALTGITILWSCKDQKEPAAASATAEKKSFFPVIDFLKGQIRYVDSLPSAILKVAINNGKADSSFIERDEFNKLAQDFILPDLEKNSFQKNFKENSFIDQTTQSATFNYTANDAASKLQRVDVLATADEQYSKVKSVFIQQSNSNKDSLTVKKLFWQTNKRLQIITIKHAAGQQNVISQLLLIWDAGE